MYDCIIIGCGPSGMTCALYLKRAGKSVLVLEKSMIGGQIALTKSVENYPSIKQIDGVNLAMQMYDQITSLGVEVRFEEVTKCNLSEKIKTVSTLKNTYQAKTVFIGTGAYTKPLNVDGEKMYIGKGVSYCATCDGALFKNKEVAIVGGGNTSLEDCIYLADIAQKVYLIHRRDEFRGDNISVEKIKKLAQSGKVEMLLSSEVVGILGQQKLNQIVVKNKKTNVLNNINIDALFIAIGRKPDTEIFEGINLDDKGYIIADEKMRTNIQGVFAGGDVRNTPLRQIVTACSDGAIASMSINEYLSDI